jgi:hypothetical protein
MATDCITQVTFTGQGFVKPVVARFDLPDASSDGGLVLLKAVDARLGLTQRAGRVPGRWAAARQGVARDAGVGPAASVRAVRRLRRLQRRGAAGARPDPQAGAGARSGRLRGGAPWRSWIAATVARSRALKPTCIWRRRGLPRPSSPRACSRSRGISARSVRRSSQRWGRSPSGRSRAVPTGPPRGRLEPGARPPRHPPAPPFSTRRLFGCHRHAGLVSRRQNTDQLLADCSIADLHRRYWPGGALYQGVSFLDETPSYGQALGSQTRRRTRRKSPRGSGGSSAVRQSGPWLRPVPRPATRRRGRSRRGRGRSRPP